MVRPWRIQQLIAGAVAVEARAAFALAAGCGLLEAEMKRISTADVALMDGQVLIWVQRREKWRRVCVPAWATLWVLVLLRSVTGDRVFSDLARGRSHRATLKTLSGGALTFHDLRRFHQQVARANGLASGLVRGSLMFEQRAVWMESAGSCFAAARRVAAAWTEVRSPPGRALEPVPRRPLPGQCAYDPERDELTPEECEGLAARVSAGAGQDMATSTSRATGEKAPLPEPAQGRQTPKSQTSRRRHVRRPTRRGTAVPTVIPTRAPVQLRRVQAPSKLPPEAHQERPTRTPPQIPFPIRRASTGSPKPDRRGLVTADPPLGSRILDYLAPKKSGGGG